MTLFPYCTDIILCISTPGTLSAHKNGSLPSVLLWCKWNWECPCLWQKTHDRNGLSRSHLHHNGRRRVHHVYFVMPNQQHSQLQNMYTLSNKNQAAWYFVRPAQAVMWRTVAIIIPVILVSPYLWIRGVSLSSIHYNQSRRVYINLRHQYIRLIWS
jgi:hypothetical protein